MVLAELARLLGPGPHFGGATPSLADLMLAAHLDMMAATPEWPALAEPHGALIDWLARMAARPSFQVTTWERLASLAA